MTKPTWDEIFLTVAETIKLRSTCIRRQVGAVLVSHYPLPDIVSFGYNGTPSGTPNCNEGGCSRCASTIASGEGYDQENCIHAEDNSILMAARRGVPTTGTVLYVTARPCLLCLKVIIQAGITKVIYRVTDTVNQLGMPIMAGPVLAPDQVVMVQSSGLSIFKYVDGQCIPDSP